MKNINIRFLNLAALLCALCLLCAACGWQTPESSGADSTSAYDAAVSRYSDPALWSFFETDREAEADTFFLCPTAAAGDFANMPVDSSALTEKFTLQVGNQKGIYDDRTRFFAPIYSQMTLQCYALSAEEQQPYFDLAYNDVRQAFEYYLHCCNGGRPIILAGSSQGAQMAMRLLKDYFCEEEMAQRLVCCYAIGWKITEEDMKDLPLLHFATGESDTQSVVSFNSELPEITSSLIVGEGEKTLCINPLSWKTEGSAEAALNLGCCIYSTKGYQKGEDLVGFCGASVDPVRGTLKLSGMEQQDPDRTLYPSRIDGQPYGVFHIYDWEFFYRNLEKNVQVRLDAFLQK